MYVHRQALAIGIVVNLLSSPTHAFGKPDVIAWSDSMSQTLSSARNLNRPVLIYVKSANCGWCRKMERSTWSDPAVVRAVTQGFVPLKVDGEQNLAWLDKLEITGFPAVVVLTASGEVLLHLEGYQSPKDLLHRLERVAHTSNSTNRH